jgi:hypothetical protein
VPLERGVIKVDYLTCADRYCPNSSQYILSLYHVYLSLHVEIETVLDLVKSISSSTGLKYRDNRTDDKRHTSESRDAIGQ